MGSVQGTFFSFHFGAEGFKVRVGPAETLNPTAPQQGPLRCSALRSHPARSFAVRTWENKPLPVLKRSKAPVTTPHSPCSVSNQVTAEL